LIIARREFLERVRTRWFLISTIMGPIFMAAIMVLPLLLAERGGRQRSIAVVDLSTGGFAERLTADLNRSQPIVATRASADALRLGSITDSLSLLVRARALDGFLIVSDETLEDGRAEYRGTNVSSPRDMQILTRYLEESATSERLTRAGVSPEAVRRARLEMHLRTSKVTEIKGATESAEGSFMLAFAMWLILYIAIMIYGVSVMGSVVEEKTSRVIELLVSSVRPVQLLSGKILGVGAVGLFQMLIWGVSGGLLIERQKQFANLFHVTGDLASFGVPHVSLLTASLFLLYFLLGYFLYAAMFAAIASSASSEAEARQAQTPVIMLLVVPTVLMPGILNDPNSSLARVLGLVPFFSPIAMPVRWAAAPIPVSELLASIVILAATVTAIAWLAGRIYRVGILMYGKRPSLREVLRWARTG